VDGSDPLPTPAHAPPRDGERSPITLLVLFLALILTGIVSVGLYRLGDDRDRALRTGELNTSRASAFAAHSLSSLLGQVDLTLRTVADETARQYAAGGVDERGLEVFIERQFRRIPWLDSLRISDRDGVVLLGSGTAPTRRVSMSDRDYYQYLLRHPEAGMVISRPVIGKISGKLVVTVARRITLSDGTYGGVVYAVIPVGHLASMLEKLSVGTGGELLLLDAGLTVILRMTGGELHAIPGGEPLPSASPLLTDLRQTHTSDATFTRESPFDGSPHIYSLSRLSDSGLSLLVGLSREDVLREYNRTRKLFGGVILLLSGGAALVVMYEYRSWKRADGVRRIVEHAAHEWQTTFDAMEESIAVMTPDRRITRCNRSTTRLLEKPFGEIVGKNCCDLFHGGESFPDCPAHDAYSRREASRASFQRGERHFEVVVQPVTGDGGEILSLVHLVRDVTLERTLTLRLKEMTDLFDLVLRHTPVLTYIKRIEGEWVRVVAASENFSQLVGLPGSVLVGKTMEEIFPPDFARKITADDLEVARRGEKIEYEEEYDGRRYLSVKFPLRRAGHETLIAGFTIDITRIRRAEEELRTMQEQLFRQDKLAAVGQLAAGIAHEINNPVGFVKSNLVSLRKYTSRLLAWVDTVDGEVLRWLPRRVKGELETRRRQLNMAYIRDDLPSVIDESLEGVERIRKIVSDLLSYARNDAEAVKPVDLLSCIDSSVSLLWNEIKHRCELIRECAPLPPVLCDPQRISQVFVNIISNALHALPPEGGRLTIQTLVEGESAVVRFIDNGSGIPADILTRIFDPFFTTKEPGKGTGLGLAISHQIVQRYGGSIEVESQEGSGTTFTIRLPVAMG